MEFRVLGPLQVVGRSGVPINLPSVSQRRLTCFLVARAGTAVSADALADHLELTPGALRTSISRLRRVVGFSTLVSRPPGYELRPDTVDASDFERHLAAAGSADAPAARRSLEEGLALWRGDAYAEFAHEEWAVAESRRLAELRTGAVEALAEILLDRREWSGAVATLEPLIAANPFRDRPRGLLMRALADSGRRTDALRAFQAYRKLLIEEVGTEPSGELIALDRAIARPPVPEVVSVSGESGARPSTENVAVLFSDMTGSTALASRLAPGAADEVRRGHFSILRQAVAEVGGHEVKNPGDGLMVVFTTASAAMSCAVAMQQGVARANRGEGQHVGLRIGLSGGEVVTEENDYFGDPVVEAARLVGAGANGQILVADVVRAMAGRRSRHQCRGIGPLALKGLSDPLETFEVLWEPEAGPPVEGVPLPARLGQRPTVPVVGREVELQAMAEAAKRVAGGGGREVMLISGEAGLGKTTLVAEAARVAFEAGACVLFGHCEEDLATPYQLFAEAMGHYVTHVADGELLDDVDAFGSELSRLVPALSTRVPHLPPSRATDTDTERYLLFGAVVGFLARASQRRPVVLVLDDLQWADTDSLELLRHLSAADQPMDVLVLGTYRDTELSYAHPLLDTLAALRRHLRVDRVELCGLDDTGVVSFLEAAAGHTLDDAGIDLARALHRETDGNPFFVGEVLRHLSETGAIYRDAEGRWVRASGLAEVGLPDSVREVIGARVARLGAAAGTVLSLAAVIGRDFDLDVLALAAQTSEDELLDVLDAAAAVALVREGPTPGRYTFVHSLIQHALNEELGPTRRARAHRVVAEALENLCGDRPGARVGELARHWFATSQPRDAGKALAYPRMAADAALAALAPADALGWYSQALDLYARSDDPDPVLGLDLGIGLGIAQRQTGDPSYRETLLDAARRAADLGDTDRLVTATLANDRGLFSTTGFVDAERVELLDIALARLPADHPDRALVLATMCKELIFGSSLERRQALADEAIAIAQSSGDDTVMVRVLNHVSQGLQAPTLVERALAWTADALARAERVGDPSLLFFAAGRRAAYAATAGDIDEMDRCLAIMEKPATLLGQPTLRWLVTLEHATRAAIAGDTDRAEQLATAAVQIGIDGGEPDATSIFGAQVLTVSFQRGTMGDLAPLIEQMAADNPGAAPTAIAVLAAAHAEADRIDDARHRLEEFASGGFELPLDMLWTTGMTLYAEAAIECRDTRAARALFERLAPWADRLSYTSAAVEGPVSHYLGGLAFVLGRYDEAGAYFAQSATFNDRVGAKFFAARTALSWGRMLAERRASSDGERARELLSEAQTAAAAHGYGTVDRRATEALQLLDA